LSEVSSPEAAKYINLGREHAYDFIDLLYRKDWDGDQKINGVRVFYMQPRLT